MFKEPFNTSQQRGSTFTGAAYLIRQLCAYMYAEQWNIKFRAGLEIPHFRIGSFHYYQRSNV
jgi:hypothetical protein